MMDKTSECSDIPEGAHMEETMENYSFNMKIHIKNNKWLNP